MQPLTQLMKTALLDRLRNYASISGSTLDWFASYLAGRCVSVAAGRFMSESVPITCGVPQGTELGLVCLYASSWKHYK